MRGIIPLFLLFFWWEKALTLPHHLDNGPSYDVKAHLEKLEQFMEGRQADRAKILDGKEKNTPVHGNIPNAGELFEGDIIMDDDLRKAVTGEADKRSAVFAPNKLWPNKIVPYVFMPGIEQKSMRCSMRAFIAFYRHTCIRFVPRTNEDDYIYIRSKPHYCASYVGKRNGKQPVTLALGCTRVGTCEHELLHALGMIHEQSRPDRDDHVEIKWDNIKKKEQHNFNKYSYSIVSNEGVPYNYMSVMHYPNHAFAIDRSKATIVSKKDPDLKFGQRFSFSAGDVKTINRLYKCKADKNSDELIETYSDADVEQDLLARQ